MITTAGFSPGAIEEAMLPDRSPTSLVTGGITIEPDTITGNWCGDHLDLDYAVATCMATPD